jgi:DNA-binding response OmpR family regulator
MRARQSVKYSPKKILVCDADVAEGAHLARELGELGYAVRAVTSYAEAFTCACRFDLTALVATAVLDDGPALGLPTALGIRRPPVVVLASLMTERLLPWVVERAGFDAQLTKIVDAMAVDRIVARRVGTLHASFGVTPRRERMLASAEWTSDRS